MPSTSLTDFYALGLAAAVAANAELTVFDGDTTDFLLAAGAAMADFCDQERASDHLNTSVDGAEKAKLTELADDHYNIDRHPATAATVTQSFVRPSAGGSEPSGTIPAGFEVSTQVDLTGDEQRFVLDDPISWSVGELGPKTVTATAIKAGSEGNVDVIGAVSRMIDTPFDASFSTDNTTLGAGGNPEETDPELRTRIRNRPKSLRRATKDALETGANEVPEVRVASATEDTATGNVTMAISDAAGNSNAEMINDVLIELELWRALGIPITVTGGVRVLVDMTLQLRLKDGQQITGLATPVSNAVSGEIDKLKQGKFLYDTLWISTAKNISPDLIEDVTITALSIGGVSQTLGDYTGTAANELLRADVITVTFA